MHDLIGTIAPILDEGLTRNADGKLCLAPEVAPAIRAQVVGASDAELRAIVFILIQAGLRLEKQPRGEEASLELILFACSLAERFGGFEKSLSVEGDAMARLGVERRLPTEGKKTNSMASMLQVRLRQRDRPPSTG